MPDCIIFIGSARDKKTTQTQGIGLNPLTIACHGIPEKRTHQGYNKRSRDPDVSVFSGNGLIKQSKEALPDVTAALGSIALWLHGFNYRNRPIRLGSRNRVQNKQKHWNLLCERA